ncbi:MAG: ABC transporter substrate-binding protein [Candidatus Omnitrophota bacterium]
MKIKNNLPALLLIPILVFLFCAYPYAQEEALRKVSFIPMWKPQAQFAGYYVASDLGIYKKYGLNVTIIEGGPDFPPAQLLKEGKADFGIMWLSAGIQRYSQGLKVVNIAQIVQRSALMLVAKKSSGILKPQDMNGRKISLWEGDLSIQPKAFFRKYNLQVKIIPQAYTVNLFLKGGVDAASAMWYNEYHTILNSGINEDELSTFFYDQYGLNFPEDGIYVLEDRLKKDPGLCRDFVKASIEGWLYAFEHQDEALDIILKYMRQAGIPANRAHQRWMLARMKNIIIKKDSPSGSIGTLSKGDYEKVVQELRDSKLVEGPVDFKEFYKPLNQ